MKIQAPRGTRDFYPAQMAWRNHLLDAWRRVSVRHGFEQVDGPIFEKLELYEVKSGPGIVSELFSFRRDQGSTDFAIRPEFTPTLARMVADKANALPKPIKWFCTPNLCRAERPQRGRLREFLQWNADILGLDSPTADAECILVALDLVREMGLGPEHVRVKISHRDTVRHILTRLGVPEEKLTDAFELLDRRDKLDAEAFQQGAARLGLDVHAVERFDQTCRMRYQVGGGLKSMKSALGDSADLSDLEALDEQLKAFGIAEWCEYDLGIVRGLAYYTGTVFELHEATGVERALAGGGRYDNLIELFGGPPTPAIGFGMGDVVLTNVLHDKGLIPDDVMPRPDVYLIAASETGAGQVPCIAAHLRMAGLHARFSYKSTRNVGRLLKDAAASRARYAVIVGDGVMGKMLVDCKDMDNGDQQQVHLDDLAERIRG